MIRIRRRTVRIATVLGTIGAFWLAAGAPVYRGF